MNYYYLCVFMAKVRKKWEKKDIRKPFSYLCQGKIPKNYEIRKLFLVVDTKYW